MSEIRSDPHTRAIRLWLYAVAALVLAMVLVGGATRLTESGLSITEWKPVMGVVPPLSDNAWQAEFEKYQAIPQYRAMNTGMASRSSASAEGTVSVKRFTSFASPSTQRAVS